MNFPASWTGTGCTAFLAGLAFVAVSGNGNPQNTGMADPVALLSAFDRFAAAAAPANVVILSLSNLRGVSSEAVTAADGSRSISRQVPSYPTSNYFRLATRSTSG